MRPVSSFFVFLTALSIGSPASAQAQACKSPEHAFFKAYYAHQELKDTASARELYLGFLQQAPQSPYAEKARTLLAQCQVGAATSPASSKTAGDAVAAPANGSVATKIRLEGLTAAEMQQRVVACRKEVKQLTKDLHGSKNPDAEMQMQLQRAQSRVAYYDAIRSFLAGADNLERQIAQFRSQRDTYAELGNQEEVARIDQYLRDLEAQRPPREIARKDLAGRLNSWGSQEGMHTLFFVDLEEMDTPQWRMQVKQMIGGIEQSIVATKTAYESHGFEQSTKAQMDSMIGAWKHFHKLLKEMLAKVEAGDRAGAQSLADKVWAEVGV